MDYLKTAMDWAIEHYPKSSIQHRCAFANSVEYFVTGASGGYGGPSLREHLCSWSLAGVNGRVEAVAVGDEALSAIYPDGTLPREGDWSFEDAVVHCSRLCFSPAIEHRSQLIRISEREHCFDDDPIDLGVLRGKL